jgi:hypothetical protein
MENVQRPPATAKGRKRNGVVLDHRSLKPLLEIENEIKNGLNQSDSHQDEGQ